MQNLRHNTAIIILAAGQSGRLRSPKQLLPWGNTTLLEHAITQAKAINPDLLIVVLGGNSDVILKKIDFQGVETVYKENWQNGMAGSIAVGVEFANENLPELHSVMIMLCDQPQVDRNYLSTLYDAFLIEGTEVAATSYLGQPGVPAVFGSRYIPELLMLKGEKGAKQLLRKHLPDVQLITPDQPLADIDTREDYEQLKSLPSYEKENNTST
ncbi:MAG: nucleotidyltransferase family protein [Cyclobacteriaceae bacterium]